MKITKAVITAAGPNQRNLPLQSLIDRDGKEKAVLGIIIEEVIRAGVQEICVVVQPGDEKAYREVVDNHAGWLFFVHQDRPLGYGHAIYSTRDFVGQDPFLHLVGDHLYVSRTQTGCAEHLVNTAEVVDCAVSAVQATRESLLPYYGAVRGHLVKGRQDLYVIDTVIEKASPTVAEQHLLVPGLRAGQYLCFFGMHVLTPTIFDLLKKKVESVSGGKEVNLSDSLAELPHHERYLALEKYDCRYDIGVKYGLLTAQLALALSGQEREEVLSHLLEVLAMREYRSCGR